MTRGRESGVEEARIAIRMPIKLKRLLAPLTLAIVVAFLWVGVHLNARRALEECFRPNTVKMLPLPAGCVPTGDAVPDNLLRLLEAQRRFYHLQIQEVTVCRTAERFSTGRQDIVRQAFGEGLLHRWMPLYVGCCSYQFGRHFLVIAANEAVDGSLVLEVALIQNRWEYFRSNWNTDRRDWY